MKRKKPLSDYWHEAMRDMDIYAKSGNIDHLHYAIKTYVDYKNLGGQRTNQRIEDKADVLLWG